VEPKVVCRLFTIRKKEEKGECAREMCAHRPACVCACLRGRTVRQRRRTTSSL
jgi:hypothetical protein